MTGTSFSAYSRWYDQEPVIAKALEDLRTASSVYQAQVSINIIKIIVEHRMEAELHEPAEASAEYPSQFTQNNPQPRRRWYDTDQTLQSALTLLQDCPNDLQKTIIPSLADMIRTTIQANLITV